MWNQRAVGPLGCGTMGRSRWHFPGWTQKVSLAMASNTLCRLATRAPWKGKDVAQVRPKYYWRARWLPLSAISRIFGSAVACLAKGSRQGQRRTGCPSPVSFLCLTKVVCLQSWSRAAKMSIDWSAASPVVVSEWMGGLHCTAEGALALPGGLRLNSSDLVWVKGWSPKQVGWSLVETAEAFKRIQLQPRSRTLVWQQHCNVASTVV